jgi:hypothetical protein
MESAVVSMNHGIRVGAMETLNAVIFAKDGVRRPQILEVNPSIAFPGSVVTIKGRLCFSDDFDLAGLDAEDRKSVIEAGDDELRIPGLATVNQVSFGDFMCSTMDDSKTTGTFYNISGGGFEATRWSSVYSCKVGSFRCKLPEDIPRGVLHIFSGDWTKRSETSYCKQWKWTVDGGQVRLEVFRCIRWLQDLP